MISVPGDLQRLRDTSVDYSKYFIFTSDIDMGGCVWSTPIANGSTSFTGRLDGDGRVINGLSVSAVNPPTSYVGLVGYLGANGTIMDLGFTGDVTVSSTGSRSTFYVGGLVAFTFAPTTISGSFASGDVTATVTSSSNTVSVYAGGLVGYSQRVVTDSFSRGDVDMSATSTATPSSSVTLVGGGAVGNLPNGTMTNVYSTGSVTGNGYGTTVTSRIGGFAGTRDNTYPSLTSLFWDTASSGLSSATGQGTSTSMSGQSTAQMKSASTYTSAGWPLVAGFDATSTWGLCSAVNGGYPFLTVFYATSPCVTTSDTAQVPPSWFQSTGRMNSAEPCEPGWNSSWAQWMNGGLGGFVCNREIYFDIWTNGWAVR